MKLEIDQVTKTFRDYKAVDDVSYTFTNGVYGLLGVNGAGKTTLMRIICTLLAPSEGTVKWNDTDILQLESEYRKILGYLPQEFGYYPEFSVEDYLGYIALIKGLRPFAAKEKTEMLLQQVGLQDMRKRKMKNLSGGMKRRAGIAQALLNNPRILILDEPTAGLDPSERVRFRNLISELSEDRIVLLSTHIVSDVEYIAKEILLMKGGRLQTSGTVDEIIAEVPSSVWECTVSRNESVRFTQAFKVSNIRNEQDGINLRIIADEAPVKNARKVPVTLEDVFLYYFGEAAEEVNE